MKPLQVLVFLVFCAVSSVLLRENLGGNPAQSQALERHSIKTLPSFSKVVAGLSVGISGPEELATKQLKEAKFSVFIVNNGKVPIAVCKHSLFVRLAIYNPQGKLLTYINKYGQEKTPIFSEISDICVLRPGEMFMTIATPISFNAQNVGKGKYKVEAMLWNASDFWSPKTKSSLWNPKVKQLLKRESVTVWNADKVASPPIYIELK